MFADIKSAGTIVVQEVLLEFLPVGIGGWVWQGCRDWWWLCPFGALTFLLWWGRGDCTNGVVGVGPLGFIHHRKSAWNYT